MLQPPSAGLRLGDSLGSRGTGAARGWGRAWGWGWAGLGRAGAGAASVGGCIAGFLVRAAGQAGWSWAVGGKTGTFLRQSAAAPARVRVVREMLHFSFTVTACWQR